MSETSSSRAFKRAVDMVGGHAAAGAICGCSRQNIHQLIGANSQCPAGYVRVLSEASGVRRCDLRPDLYPEVDEPPRPPEGWGVKEKAEPGPAELERAGQLRLLPEGDE